MVSDVNLKDSLLEYTIEASSKPIEDLDVRLTVLNKGTGEGAKYEFSTVLGKLVPVEETPPEEEFSVEKKVKRVAFPAFSDSFGVPLKGDGLRIVKVEVKGKDVWERFEKPFIIGRTKAVYNRELPEKEKEFLKPKEMVLLKDDKTDILYIHEAYVEKYWRLEDVAKASGEKVNLRPSSMDYVAWKGSAEVSYFPTSYEEMLSYDVVILQAHDGKALGDLGQEMIKDFVDAGGGVLFLGGYFSFGKSRPGDSAILSQIMPVEIRSAWDLVRADDSSVRIANHHPVLDGISLNPRPHVFWYHSVKPKKGSETILAIDGDKPLFVLAQYGKGRAGAFTGCVLGGDDKNETPFFAEWDGYESLITNILDWLTAR